MYLQEVEREEVGIRLERGLGRKLKMLLLKLTGLRVLMTEDEVDLRVVSRISVPIQKHAYFRHHTPLCRGTSSQDQP